MAVSTHRDDSTGPRRSYRWFSLAVGCAVLMAAGLYLKSKSPAQSEAPPTSETSATGSAAGVGDLQLARNASSPEISPSSGISTPAKPVNGIEQEVARARETRDAQALTALARRFASGKGTSRDFARARQLAQEAVALGDPRAMYELARYAEKGLGGPVAPGDALHWYEKAAAAGYVDGYAAIARMYIEGKSFSPDRAKADVYIEKGVAAGSPAAMFLRGITLLDAGASQEAVNSLTRSAALGDPDAQTMLSRLFQEGKQVPRDPEKALELARSAAAQDSVRAKVNLARLLLASDTEFSASDSAMLGQEIVSNLYAAEDQGSANAALELAGLYLRQKSLTVEELESIRALAAEAFDRGQGQAALLAALAYATGPDADLPTAQAWLDRSVQDGQWQGKYARQLMQREGLIISDAIKKASASSYSDFAASVAGLANAATGIVPPTPVNLPMPKFPPGLASLAVDGVVTARFLVDTNGKPASVEILGATHPELQAATLYAISQWSFRPAMKNGAYHPMKIEIPIVFRSGN